MTLDLKAFASQVRVIDGVYGTELQRRGLAPVYAAELLNAEDPDVVEAIAHSYVEAGSDVIMTNSLCALRFGLERIGAAGRAAELAEAAARISKRAAAGTDVKVFGSFGPSGKILMTGEVTEEELFAAFTETAEALAWGGADAIMLETFTELAEAKIALAAVRKACDLPVVVSMSFDSGPDKAHTMMGAKPADLAAMAKAGGAAAVGANCGIGPAEVLPRAKLLAEATDLPIWIKPNAGLPEVHLQKTTFPIGPDEFASYVAPLVEAGANFIGGCCGCGPDHIRAIRQAVDRL